MGQKLQASRAYEILVLHVRILINEIETFSELIFIIEASQNSQFPYHYHNSFPFSFRKLDIIFCLCYRSGIYGFIHKKINKFHFLCTSGILLLHQLRSQNTSTLYQFLSLPVFFNRFHFRLVSLYLLSSFLIPNIFFWYDKTTGFELPSLH